jgi:aconitate decarboxylase
VNPELSNEEIVEKFRLITRDFIDDERREKIEKTCLATEELDDVMALGHLLDGVTENPIA